jgi:hypothetical protein
MRLSLGYEYQFYRKTFDLKGNAKTVACGWITNIYLDVECENVWPARIAYIYITLSLHGNGSGQHRQVMSHNIGSQVLYKNRAEVVHYTLMYRLAKDMFEYNS